MDNLNFQYNYKIPELSNDIRKIYQKKATDSKNIDPKNKYFL